MCVCVCPFVSVLLASLMVEIHYITPTRLSSGGVDVGSALFHATLTQRSQVLDETPMSGWGCKMQYRLPRSFLDMVCGQYY